MRPNKRRLQSIRNRIEELRNEASRLVIPLPHAEAFHACTKKVVIGDGSNQSAKSFHFALEVMRALCNCDPYHKYPKGGLAILVGLDGDHLADPMYKKLFKPGEFKLIRDEHTRQLRSVRPDPNNPLRLDPYDEAYREKWIDAPPLIPPRFVKRMAFEDVAKEIPRITELHTGWRILWRSSGGKPPQGVQAALAWADEELKSSNLWVNEIIPRLIKEGGRFLWSATPQRGGPELYELRKKADDGSPYVASFTFLIKDNPYMSQEEKDAFRSLLTSETEVRVRYDGEYAIVGRLVYPTYDPLRMHGCEPFEIPPNWTRYAIVDPGTENCVTLLCAIDPDEKHAWIYGGFLLHKADAVEWAYALKERERGVSFEGIIIDDKAGSQRSLNAPDTTAQRFAKAMEVADVKPRSRGSVEGFFPGDSNVKSRTLALRGWLALRPEGDPFAGLPRLQVMRGVVPELDRQIQNATTSETDQDKRMKYRDKPCDFLDTLEYCAAFDPRYYATEPVDKPKLSFAVKDFLERQGKRRENHQPSMSLG